MNITQVPYGFINVPQIYKLFGEMNVPKVFYTCGRNECFLNSSIALSLISDPACIKSTCSWCNKFAPYLLYFWCDKCSWILFVLLLFGVKCSCALDYFSHTHTSHTQSRSCRSLCRPLATMPAAVYYTIMTGNSNITH